MFVDSYGSSALANHPECHEF